MLNRHLSDFTLLTSANKERGKGQRREEEGERTKQKVDGERKRGMRELLCTEPDWHAIETLTSSLPGKYARSEHSRMQNMK